MGDRLLRGLVRLLLRVFYRRIEVVGLDRVPATGPVIVAANHQNALVDPMLLLATIPRRLRPLAKAPLFRHPVIGPFLCLAGAIPVHRRQDPGSDPAQNVAMFRAAAATLGAGGAILIFPEGVSQAEPVLMPLRTGAARILLGAAERVTLLPVGLTFHEPGSFRAGWALVLVGTPVPVDDCVARARMEPEAAVRETTDRLAEALRRLIVEARDRQILRLLGIAEAIWRAEAGEPAADPTARTAWMQQALRGYRYLSARDSARVDALMREVERYAKDLELAGLAGDELPPAYPGAAVARYALREGLSLFGGLPLALWGLANHGIPYQATAAAVRLLRPSPDTEARPTSSPSPSCSTRSRGSARPGSRGGWAAGGSSRCSSRRSCPRASSPSPGGSGSRASAATPAPSFGSSSTGTSTAACWRGVAGWGPSWWRWPPSFPSP